MINSEVEVEKPNYFLRILLTIVVVFFFLHNKLEFDETPLKGTNMKPFSTPVQVNLAPSERKTIKVEYPCGYAIVTPVAKYKIYGRVGARRKVVLKSHGGMLAKYDLTLVYGDLAKKELFNKLKIYMVGYMSYYRINEYINGEEFTNNHIICANENVEKGISKLRRKDIVYLEGYLVTSEMYIDGMKYTRGTSMTRSDTGNHACEQIYVTKAITKHGTFE